MADCTTLCSAGRALSRILRLRSSSLLTLFLADARVLCRVRDDDSTDVSSRTEARAGRAASEGAALAQWQWVAMLRRWRLRVARLRGGSAVHVQLERRGVGDAGAVGDLGGADTSGAFAGDLCSGGGGTAGEEAYAARLRGKARVWMNLLTS